MIRLLFPPHQRLKPCDWLGGEAALAIRWRGSTEASHSWPLCNPRDVMLWPSLIGGRRANLLSGDQWQRGGAYRDGYLYLRLSLSFSLSLLL